VSPFSLSRARRKEKEKKKEGRKDPSASSRSSFAVMRGGGEEILSLPEEKEEQILQGDAQKEEGRLIPGKEKGGDREAINPAGAGAREFLSRER